MQTNPVVEQNKNIKWSESPLNQSGKRWSAQVAFGVVVLARCRLPLSERSESYVAVERRGGARHPLSLLSSHTGRCNCVTAVVL